jgi:hypothetical protein
MKYLVLIISLLFLNTFTFSQSNSLLVHLSSEEEVFYVNESLVLSIKLTNPSKTSIYIPDTFNVSSNICSNGLEEFISGGNIIFNLQPISDFCSLFIEDQTIVPIDNFIELKPNYSYTFKYDFGKHINKVNYLDCDTLGIKLNEKYTIRTEYIYYNNLVRNDKVFYSGKAESNVLELEIR